MDASQAECAVAVQPYPDGYATNSAYHNALAERLRARLFELLGPFCAECGCDLRGKPWEVNHIRPRAWMPRKLCRYRRNLRYWREAQEGLVNLLCKECNAVFRPRADAPLHSVGEPF